MRKRFLAVLMAFCMALTLLPGAALAAEGEYPQAETVPLERAGGATEAEENNSFGSANRISVNTEISGNISSGSDQDWYVFQLPSDGYISLTFAHDYVDTSRSCWETTLYTSENKELDSWEWKGNATSAATENKVGVPAGTYYLRIKRGYSYSALAYRFTVNYTASNFWEKEFNETIVTANRIPVSTEISGNISINREGSDVDWYSFQLPSDGHISLTFDHDYVDSSSSGWETAFYTSENKELDSCMWKGNTTTALTDNEIGLPAGIYYLCVQRGTNFPAATYRFTVNYTSSGFWEKEFNETIVAANGPP